MEATVSAPTVHHNHWGIEMRFAPGESCWEWTTPALKQADNRGWSPFHQGGHHAWGQNCGGWHYLEFWRLDGDEDHRAVVQQFLLDLVPFQ